MQQPNASESTSPTRHACVPPSHQSPNWAEQRALDFWLSELLRGYHEGWIEERTYRSWRDHAASGRASAQELEEAVNALHESYHLNFILD